MRFGGYGKGKGSWTKRRYLADGTVLDDGETRSSAKKSPAIRHRFQPFTTHQVTAEAAKRAGAHRKGKATHFTTEKQLNTYLANEKVAGRFAVWKEHDQASDLTLDG